jgi:uroporphyrinogen-III synthase
MVEVWIKDCDGEKRIETGGIIFIVRHHGTPQSFILNWSGPLLVIQKRQMKPFKCLLALVFCLLHPGNSFAPEVRQNSRQASSTVVLAAASEGKVTVAVTREDGKNSKLIDKIEESASLRDHVEVLELPCIEHASGPDYDRLQSTLVDGSWDYVAVTSPEAANVLASVWDAVRDKPVAVAAVGKATEKTLEKFGIPVSFVPSKATADTLAAELELKGEGTTLLYPASARAQNTLQNGLEARGFKVTRLNTYDTITASWTEEQKEKAKRVKVACFASPSSIKGWLLNTDGNKDVIAACIGETSATACRGHSWREGQIYYPESPGIEGWVESIQNAVLDLKVTQS